MVGYVFHAGFFFEVWHHWSDPSLLVKHSLTQLGKQTVKEYHEMRWKHLSTFRPSCFRSIERD